VKLFFALSQLLAFSQAAFALESATRPFSAPDSAAQSEVVATTLSNGAFFVGWVDSIKTSSDCRFSVSRDHAHWTPILKHASPGYELGTNPALAADENGELYVVCLSARGDYSKGALEFARSSDHGNTWSPWKKIITEIGGVPDKPAIEAKGKNLRVVYTDLRPQKSDGMAGLISEIMSFDSGSTWSQPRRLSSGQAHDPANFRVRGEQGASIAQTMGQDFLSFGDYGGGSITWKARADHGRILKSTSTVATSDVNTPITQTLTRDGKNITILWYDAHVFGNVFVASSFDAGKTWESRKQLSASGSLAVAAFDSSDVLHVMWTDSTPDHRKLVHAHSGDQGRNFSTPQLIQTWADAPDFIQGAYQGLTPAASGVEAFWIKSENGAGKIYQTHIATPVSP